MKIEAKVIRRINELEKERAEIVRLYYELKFPERVDKLFDHWRKLHCTDLLISELKEVLKR